MTLVLGVVLGIIVGYTSSYSTEIAIASLLLICLQVVALLVTIFVCKRGGIHTVSIFYVYTILIFCGVCIGIVRVQMVHDIQAITCQGVCTVEGDIVRTPKSKDSFQEVTVEVDARSLYIQAHVPLYPSYTIGERLRMTGVVTLPENMSQHTDGKAFDYLSYLYGQHVGSQMYFPKVEVVDKEAHSLSAYLGRVKVALVKDIQMYVSAPASSLASGMLFGDDSMSDDLKNDFRSTGVSHIVVLSGFNIAILISCIVFILRFVPLFLRVSVASVCVILFVIMVGTQASIVRATLMSAIALMATLFGRMYVAKQALLVSLFAIILYDPHALLYDASLHLSFLATAGIVYMEEFVRLYASRYIRKEFLLELFSTTFSAYIATLPYSMYAFGTASLYALLTNILVLPVVPIGMLSSFIVVVCAQVSSNASFFFGYITSIILDYIITVVTLIAKFPYAYIHVDISLVMMFIIYGVLVICVVLLDQYQKNETLRTSATTQGILLDDDVFSY
jgi:competence protein ComEC